MSKQGKTKKSDDLEVIATLKNVSDTTDATGTEQMDEEDDHSVFTIHEDEDMADSRLTDEDEEDDHSVFTVHDDNDEQDEDDDPDDDAEDEDDDYEDDDEDDDDEEDGEPRVPLGTFMGMTRRIFRTVSRLAKPSIYELLEEDIRNSDMSLQEKNERLSGLIKARGKNVNIILTGATGSGKSSTINALFDMSVAKVGVGVDPETICIDSYELENLVIWDTPGLGDGLTDEEYGEMIVEKLSEFDENGDPLIDLVLVIIDASSKDLGTTYSLINDVIIPCLGDDAEGRILIGINQADMAMKGKHWDEEKNEPDEVLYDFLKKKAESVRARISSVTGVDTRPIFYCAGYTDEDGVQCKPYNLTKLLYYIVKSIPAEKRLSLADNINDDEDSWLYDDEEEDYIEEIQKGFFESIGIYMHESAEKAGDIGEEILGIPGKYIGKFVGGTYGVVRGFFKTIFGNRPPYTA